MLAELFFVTPSSIVKFHACGTYNFMATKFYQWELRDLYFQRTPCFYLILVICHFLVKLVSRS